MLCGKRVRCGFFGAYIEIVMADGVELAMLKVENQIMIWVCLS